MTRGGAVAARVAHNHKVVGSSPAPATKKRVPVYLGLFHGRWARTQADDSDFTLVKYDSRRFGRQEVASRSPASMPTSA
jgi:hypothetical protein